MKRLVAMGAMLALVGSATLTHAQSVANYAPVIRTTGATFTSIAGTGASIGAWRNGTNTDDNRSIATPIGFTFYYMGQPVTTFSVSTNGFLDFSASGASGGGSSAYGSSNTAFTSTIAPSPLILAPMYDNLTVQGNPGTGAGLNAAVKYQTLGAPGSRVCTVEWIGLETSTDTSPDLNFQVKLYEATGVIEYVYGTMTQGSATYTYSCGINGLTMSATPLPSELLAQAAANSSTFNNLEHNALATVPASNVKVTFTPAYNATPAAPVSLTFSSVTQSSMTLQWADNSTNETFFTVSRSTDNVNFAPVGTVTSISTPGTGVTYNLNQSGLAPGTTYYFRVTAANEASAPSTPLTGNQATPPPGTIVSAGSGNWSSTTPNAPWPGGVVPTSADNVTIAAGHTVTIDANAACFSLGVAGSLVYEPANIRTLNVMTNVSIFGGGTLSSAATGTVTTHQLAVGGTLINNGTLDFSTNANTAGAEINFSGSAFAQLTGTGATTDVRAITVNKGNSFASVLDLSPSNFTVQGSAGDPAGFLTLLNGTLLISGGFPLSNRLFATAAWTIPGTSGLWLNDPNLNVVGQAAAVSMNGLLRIASGTMNIGTGSGNSVSAAAGAWFDIQGGTLTASSRIATSNAVVWSQTGGTVMVANSGNGQAGAGSLDLSSTISSFQMSGGTIILRQASSAATPLDWRVASESIDITGGTLQLGTSTTSTRFNFRIVGALPNLVINNQTTNKIATLFGATPATRALLNVTIPFGGTLDLNGVTFQHEGATLQNDGAITASALGSRLTFKGNAAQSYIGNGVINGPIERVTFDNPSGVTLGATTPNIVATRVDLTRGTVTNSNHLTLGNGGASSATVQIGRPFLDTAGGSFGAAPNFNVGSGGYTIIYETEGAARTTSVEIPPSRNVSAMSVGNPYGVTLAGGGLTATGSLLLQSGVLTTSNANLLTLASSVSSPPAGSTSSFVSGPLAIQINTATPASRTYAIGKSFAFRRLTLNQVNTGGVSKTFIAEVIAGSSGGTPVSPLESLDPARYWTLSNTAGLNSGARIVLAFEFDDNVTNVSGAKVAQSSAVSGNYISLGGTGTGSPASGSVESTADATPGNGFFTIGYDPPSISWDGGAGTSLWGDAANWSPDGVPTASDDVMLALGVPTPISVNGSFSCRTLGVGANVSLALGSGTLAISQAYDQTAGTVNLGTGSITVTGATTMQGGSLATASGTFTGAGAITLSGSTVTLSAPGRLISSTSFTLSGGSIDLGTGTLVLNGSFSRTAGTFTASTGTTLLSGTAAQNIGGGVTHYDLVLRNGGAGQPKRLAAGQSFSASHDFTVESSAQLGVSTATATTLTVGGDLRYAGLTGGPNLSSLTISLTGSGKTIGGASLAAEKSELPSANAALSPVEMNLAVAPGASYTLVDNIALVSGSSATDAGRLNCGSHAIGGVGSLVVAATGTLGIGVDDPQGLGALIATTGPNTYANGCIVEYNGPDDQTINTANHPATAMIYTAGTGVKSLDGDVTLTGISGAALTKAAIWVGAGTTFATDGYRVTLAALGSANVIVDGGWSQAGGTLAFVNGTAGSSLQAANGTAFGNLIVNFADAAGTVNLRANAPATLTFDSVTLGGANGTGTAGGTIALSAAATTNVVVTGALTRSPVDVASSGGGFMGADGKTSTVTVRGAIASTSTAAIQPLLSGLGTNTLILAGLAPQSLTLAAGARVVEGATLRLANSNGLTLGGSGLVYAIGGTLDLAAGNVTTGSNTLHIPAGATLLAAGGHVIGALRKHIASGDGVNAAFEIGSGAEALPVTLGFAHVSAAGEVTVLTTAAEHPDIANSMLVASEDVNRYWSLSNAGVVFDGYDATFTFLPGDLDLDAQPDSFAVRRLDGGTWWPVRVGTRTATTIQALGVASMSDFVTGEADSFLIAASAGPFGAIDPSGIVRVARDGSQMFSITPDPTVLVQDVTVDGVSVGPVTEYTFAAVSADHFIAATFADTTHPSVQLVSPVGGEHFMFGNGYAIQWSASDNVGVSTVDLLLSRNGAGGSFAPIATGISNSGSFSWLANGPATTNAFVKVVAHDLTGLTSADVSDSAFVIASNTAVEMSDASELTFAPVQPNPMRHRGTFGFSIPAEARVRLTVLDVQGREIARLADGTFSPGRYQLSWNVGTSRSRVAPGLYFARLEARGKTLVRRFVVEE